MDQSYKILAAKKLNLDPAALLMYFELDERAIVTTPDQQQHIFTFAELRKQTVRVDPHVVPPAIPIAKSTATTGRRRRVIPR